MAALLDLVNPALLSGYIFDSMGPKSALALPKAALDVFCTDYDLLEK